MTDYEMLFVCRKWIHMYLSFYADGDWRYGVVLKTFFDEIYTRDDEGKQCVIEDPKLPELNYVSQHVTKAKAAQPKNSGKTEYWDMTDDGSLVAPYFEETYLDAGPERTPKKMFEESSSDNDDDDARKETFSLTSKEYVNYMLGVDNDYTNQYDRHGGEYPRSVIALVCSAIVVTVQWCLRWVTTPIEEMEEYLDAQVSNEHFDSRPFKTLKHQIQAREETRLPYEYSILYYTILYYTILHYTMLCYTILYCAILYCNALHSITVYCTIQYYTALYCAMLHHTVL